MALWSGSFGDFYTQNYIFDCRYGLLGNKIECIVIIVIIPHGRRSIMILLLLSYLEIKLYYAICLIHVILLSSAKELDLHTSSVFDL